MDNKKQKVILSLSGGMDSTTLLAYHLDRGDEVKCVNFYYGSKHNDMEQKAIEKIVEYYRVDLVKINIDFIGDLFKSNLLKSGGEIPKGHYEQDNMSLTVVPGRNSIFTTVLSGYAESIGYDAVSLGVHGGDHAVYKDCRKEYILAMKAAMYLSSGINLIDPFIDIDKSDICKIGLGLNVPYELTHTCYDPQPDGSSCAECGCCVERISSFMKHRAIDPIKYAKEVDWSRDWKEFEESQKK